MICHSPTDLGENRWTFSIICKSDLTHDRVHAVGEGARDVVDDLFGWMRGKTGENGG